MAVREVEAIWTNSFKIRGNIVVQKYLCCVFDVLLPHSSLVVYLMTMQSYSTVRGLTKFKTCRSLSD